MIQTSVLVITNIIYLKPFSYKMLPEYIVESIERKTKPEATSKEILDKPKTLSMRENCPYSEFFSSEFSCFPTEYGDIRILFTQCICKKLVKSSSS